MKRNAPAPSAASSADSDGRISGAPGRPVWPPHCDAFLLSVGVILPVATLSAELTTHMCGTDFFDPIPTWWHVGLVALVPAINLLVWLCASTGRCSQPRLLFHLNAFAIGIAAVYGVLFLPMAPWAVVLLLFAGFGLLPLTPLLSFASTLKARRAFRRFAPAGLQRPSIVPGLLAAALSLGLPFAWDYATLKGLEAATTGNDVDRRQAVGWLRTVGHGDFLLESCYRTPRWRWGQNLLWSGQATGVPVEAAREVYYRVTGIEHTALPAPTSVSLTGQRGWRTWNFDAGLGGTAVAGKVPGLTMEGSRLDGKVDPDANTAYTEWTLVFKNIASTDGEARAQIELPPVGSFRA